LRAQCFDWEKKRQWQDVVYVLSYFGKNIGKARKGYISYIKEGIGLGRRPELVGGALIRSLGGWDKIKEMRLNRHERIKSDQRILGESDFVVEVLSESQEAFSRKYKLKSKGYNFDKVVDRVSKLFKVDKDYITGKGRQKERVLARDLLSSPFIKKSRTKIFAFKKEEVLIREYMVALTFNAR
jgi:putative transposase